MNVLVSRHGGDDAIGCGDDGLFDMGAEQVANGEDAGNGGLQLLVDQQAAFCRGIELAHEVIGDGLVALQVNEGAVDWQRFWLTLARVN